MNFIFSLVFTIACSGSNVLILGDSQASHVSWGGAIQDTLESCGAEVERQSYTGYNTSRLLALAPDNGNNYNIVVLITGDNDNNRTYHIDSAIELVHQLQTDSNTVYYSIPYLRTPIASMSRAQRVFPAIEGGDSGYWVEGERAEAHMYYRELFKDSIREHTEAMILDLHKLAIVCDEHVPDFPDGIHIPYRFALDIAECIYGA